ncbi:MAG: nucleotidyltransferase domain-containing protein [Polyangiaceae bacterium]
MTASAIDQAGHGAGPDGVAARLSQYFAGAGGDFAAVYLFGSTARGDDKAGSDIDLAVVCHAQPTPPVARLHAEVAGALERLFERPVEIVDLETAPVDLVHRILSDGILVHESDPSKRVAVETRRRAEYFDLLPILKEYRRARDVS